MEEEETGSQTDQPSSPKSKSKLPFRPRKLRRLSSNPTTKTPSTPSSSIPRSLSSPSSITLALSHLHSSDPLLSPLISSLPSPTFHSLHTPFHSLTRSILYQQLATKPASSIYSRFLSLTNTTPTNPLLPQTVLSLTPHDLRQAGVSSRKASYLHDLSHKYMSGILSDDSILQMDDERLLSMLTMVKGIGAWSVHMFMIFSLGRPDVLPVGDLGVRKGVRMLYGMEEVPKPAEMEGICEKWRPYRTVGSWYMWRLVESKGKLV